ncbi:MAG: hypothetical protein RL108_736 [Bacteroidota bacterium]|jgi:hypothetical protein
MKKISLILLVSILIGCSKSNSIEEQFLNKPDDCWVVYSQNQSHYTFWKFNKDKTSDNLSRDEKGDLKNFNIDGDLVIGPLKWQVSSDSILSWGMHKYDIINANKNLIVLMYEENKTHLQGHIFLVKENKSTLRKGEYYYEQKRLRNPNKYFSNN